MTTIEQRNAILEEAKQWLLRNDKTLMDALYWLLGIDREPEKGRSISDISQKMSDPDFQTLDAMTQAFETIEAKECSIFFYDKAPGRSKYERAALFDHAKEQPL